MPHHPDDADAALMLQVAKGDRSAFEKLLQKYQRSVYNTAYRYVGHAGIAEELAQDVFLRVYRAASSYVVEAKFTTWLFTITKNVCMNYRQRQGRIDHLMNVAEDEAIYQQHREASPEKAAIKKELQHRIQEAIDGLPEILKLPLILNHFNQLQYGEIAEILGISLGAVKVRIHRAKLALADKLQEYSLTIRNK